MERIDHKEGESFHFGGFPITVGHARGGRVILFVGSGECETTEDTERLYRKMKAKLDRPPRGGQNSG
jgi:hypothetical protein